MFRFDGIVMRKLTKLTYILYVHILALACFLPIVTAGAGFTALEYVLLKIHREDDAYLTRNFFRSFKENFWPATLMWVLYLLAGSLVLFNIYFLGRKEIPGGGIIMLAMYIIGILLLTNMTWGFVLLSRYCNSAMQTVKYAFSVGLIHIGKTLVMVILVAVPLILGLEFFEIAPFALIFGSILSGWARPKMYSKVFDKIEKNNNTTSDKEN